MDASDDRIANPVRGGTMKGPVWLATDCPGPWRRDVTLPALSVGASSLKFGGDRNDTFAADRQSSGPRSGRWTEASAAEHGTGRIDPLPRALRSVPSTRRTSYGKSRSTGRSERRSSFCAGFRTDVLVQLRRLPSCGFRCSSVTARRNRLRNANPGWVAPTRVESCVPSCRGRFSSLARRRSPRWRHSNRCVEQREEIRVLRLIVLVAVSVVRGVVTG